MSHTNDEMTDTMHAAGFANDRQRWLRGSGSTAGRVWMAIKEAQNWVHVQDDGTIDVYYRAAGGGARAVRWKSQPTDMHLWIKRTGSNKWTDKGVYRFGPAVHQTHHVIKRGRHYVVDTKRSARPAHVLGAAP